MAVAPPQTRELDILALAESREGELGTVALLRYLRLVRPRVLVLMGRAWTAHLRGVHTFKDALLAGELERLIVSGARVYVLDPRQRDNGTIALPGGRAVEHRRELRLRIEGKWVWFGDESVFRSRLERLSSWSRAWIKGERPAYRRDRLESFAEAVGRRALAENVDAVVCADAARGLRTVVGEGERHCTVLSPGQWHESQRSLEFRFGRWALRAATAREEGLGGSGMRERFVYGRHALG